MEKTSFSSPSCIFLPSFCVLASHIIQQRKKVTVTKIKK